MGAGPSGQELHTPPLGGPGKPSRFLSGKGIPLSGQRGIVVGFGDVDRGGKQPPQRTGFKEDGAPFSCRPPGKPQYGLY